MDDYSKAFFYDEIALEICKKTHSYLAAAYALVSTIYYSLGELSKALSFYQRAVDIGHH
jgi:tetratricopeptide (TPR) repeat protein